MKQTSKSIETGDYITRSATPADAEALLELRLEALSLHPEAFAADVEKTASAGSKAWVERINEYARDQSGAIIIANVGEKIIGMSGIVRGHWPKTRHSGEIWGVYVTPGWRGKRVGEAIVNGCVKWAVDHQLAVITLGVTVSNTPAIRCYSRCGFTVFGLQPMVTLYNGVYHDNLWMVKLIEAGRDE